MLRFYLENNRNQSFEITDKDFWVYGVLKQLVEMRYHKNIAFKGGTPLSKVFNIIDRFSEDVDITIVYRDFDVFTALELNGSETMPLQFISGGERLGASPTS